MRRKSWAAGVALMLAASLSAAEIDFSDFDDTVMRDMDDGIKELDATVSARNGSGALATAAALDGSLSWVEKYFANKPEAPLALGYARDTRANVAALVTSLEAQDFDTAYGHVRAVARSCKVCHEAYKPPE
jgi:hypothetical protein